MKPPICAHQATAPPADGRKSSVVACKYLHQEPEAREDNPWQCEEERNEDDRDQHDDLREREQSHVATQNAGYRTGGAKCRNSGCRIEHDMGD